MSGRSLIACMFLFALCVTAGLYTYWNLHTGPFRHLTDTLGQRFPGSSPRVEGGQHGLHRETPRVLRIVMRVEFHPLQEESRFQDHVEQVQRIVREQLVIENYDLCEIHLFQQLPEQTHVLRSVRIPFQDMAPTTH
ncbi:MAG: hypothetical protein R3C12_12015 [Planctomycetaceae bacterium]